MTILVDIRDDSSERWLETLGAALPGQEIVWWNRSGGNEIAPGTAEWVLVWHPDPGLVPHMAAAQAVFSMGAGVDHILALKDLPRKVPIVRFVDADLANRMSEWIVLQCLMHLRQQRRYDALQEKKQWRTLPQPVAGEIRVGILGLGTLGADAAGKLKAMGFRVSGWSRTGKEIAGVETYAGTDELDRFLAGTDILVSLLPHTPETAGFVDRSVLARLSRCPALGGPVFVNAGRGGTQVEADIVSALRDGTLGGVSLDVFETEPLPAESPLWSLPNAIVTPHVAAWSSYVAVARHVARQIARVEAGEPLEHLVDREAGY